MLLVYKFVAFGIFMEFKCVNALVLIVNVSSTQEGELQTAAFYATLTYAENKNHFLVNKKYIFRQRSLSRNKISWIFGYRVSIYNLKSLNSSTVYIIEN